MDIPDSATLRTTAGFTLAFWYRASDRTGSIMARPYGVDTMNTWQVEFSGTRLYFVTSDGSSNYSDGITAPSAGVWHFVALTWDGTRKRFYLNGSLRQTVTRAVSFDAHGMVIGGDYNAGSFVLPFNGYVDDVRLYNRPLSATEVTQLYTAIPGDLTPPVITAVAASAVTTSSATIAWTTDEASTTQVEYGPTTAYGSLTTLDATLATSHAQSLTGLTANTPYHYRVRSRDAAGNEAVSGDFAFTTAAPADTTAPVITAVAASAVTTSSATIAWTTDEASTTQVEYGPTTAYGSLTTLDATLATSHAQSLTGLTANTPYHYRVRSRDAAGNEAVSGDFAFVTLVPGDTTAPTIAGVTLGSVNAVSATIHWGTNEPATAQIEYGLTTAYGSVTSLDPVLETAHSQTVTGLTAGVQYHYRVKSRDAAGNESVSGDFTFDTYAGAAGSFQSSIFADNLEAPTAIQFSPDGRLFISQKNGRIRLVKNGQLLTAPFLTLTVATLGEQGLMGIAFDPSFSINGYVYVFYTAPTPAVHNRVSRFTAAGDVAVAGSEVVLLDLPAAGNANHQGGALQFGPDGKLYVSVGDAVNSANAQSLGNPFGKILRINADGTIPDDNPFHAQTTGIQRAIWAYGFRNPFTFHLDRVTGRIFVNDVGEATWEEVNELTRGANYGWPTCEGPQNTGVGVCNNAAFTYPLHAYRHGTVGEAIAGGAFYRASQFPFSYYGAFFFGDYTRGWINYLAPENQVPGINNPATTFSSVPTVVDLKVGPDGALYAASIAGDSVQRISFASTGNRAPTAVLAATPTFGSAPLTVNFSASGSSDPDLDSLTYSWNFGDGTPAATGATVNHIYSQPGPYTATLTVSDGFGGTGTASTQISVGTRPQPTITLPAVDARYSAGGTISYAGTATDAEDGALDASRFSWTITFHHDDHFHPFLGPINGATEGSFDIPQIGETSANVFYRIALTVTDSTGLTNTITRDVAPNTVTISLEANIPGLMLTLDGQPSVAPINTLGVVGVFRNLGAPSPQNVNGREYEFVSWSDGGAQTHAIPTPAASGVYTATFREVPDTNPPVISAVTSGAISSESALIAWTTNEAATTQVEYGLSTAYGSQTALETTLTTAHSQGLAGLLPGTPYHYRVRSRDAAGNEAVSGDFTFLTAPPPDVTAPILSAVTSSSITSASATISWTTDEASTTQVEYGLTTAYGSQTPLNGALVTAHSQALTGLSPTMLYHYRVRSRDAAGNEAVSGDFTFTTAAAPGIAGLVGHWTLDETTGRAAADGSGNGNNGTLTDTVIRATGANCKFGGCLQFNSNTARVDIPYSTSLNTPTGFSVAFWYRATSNTGSIIARVLGTASLNTWQVRFASGRLNAVSSNGSSTSNDGIVSPAAGSWRFVVVTWDGTTKKMYLDGALQLSVARSISFDAHGLVLGGDYNNGTFGLPYRGFIDEVRLFNRALTGAEIASLYGQTN